MSLYNYLRKKVYGIYLGNMQRQSTTLLTILLLLNSCNNINDNPTNNQDSVSLSNFTYKPSIPNNIDVNNIEKYSIENYWSNYNFSDSNITLINNYGEQAFVDFLNKFSNFDTITIRKSVQEFIHKLSKQSSSNTSSYFINIVDSYLYNSNSPFYNEIYYEYFLENLINSDLLNPNQKLKYQTILNLVRKNQVGSKATDFSFLSENNLHTLYSIKAENIIIIFYEPSCPVCQETIDFLKSSEKLRILIETRNVQMLAVYPDGDKDIWQNYKSQIPNNWINAIDPDKKIIKRGLYDLKASPTIYLLDKNKIIIAKDCQLEFIKNKFNL